MCIDKRKLRFIYLILVLRKGDQARFEIYSKIFQPFNAMLAVHDIQRKI